MDGMPFEKTANNKIKVRKPHVNVPYFQLSFPNTVKTVKFQIYCEPEF